MRAKGSVIIQATLSVQWHGDEKEDRVGRSGTAVESGGGGGMSRTRTGHGQTALVTGASAGIGVDLAECFAQDGYDVILAARTESALRDVAERLTTTYGITATPIAVDLGPSAAARDWLTPSHRQGLSVDVLVNNAGYGHAGAFNGSDARDATRHDRPERSRAGRADAHLLAGDAGQQARRRPQRGVDRGVSARAADGDLLRVEGVRPVVLGSVVGRSARHRREGQLPLPRVRPSASSASARARTKCGSVAPARRCRR